MYLITTKEILGENIYLFELLAPQLAKKASAGQFVIVRTDEKGERIPLTIADYNRQRGTITIIFQVVGLTTQKLAQLNQGDYLLDLVGPLGEPSKISKLGTVVCVGGGVGIAPIYPVAKELKKAGNKVISIIGARCESLLFWQEKMAEVSDQLLIATDDGSIGRKGFVTDILKKLIETEKIDHLWAIGPIVMMKAVAGVTLPSDIKTTVSLNPIMVDGTGMCGCCRVQVGQDTKFACVDGPEFDGHLVDFDLAARRLTYYREEEQRALNEHHKCANGGGCQCH